MRQILDFLRSVFSSFWLDETKLILKSPSPSFVVNLAQYLSKSGSGVGKDFMVLLVNVASQNAGMEMRQMVCR